MAEERRLRKPWARLEGKIVMVTGASSGLGRELCLDLAAAGCTVLAAARRADRLAALCDELRRTPQPDGSPPPRAAAVQLDLSSDCAAIDLAVNSAWSIYGPIDALVNNAGVRGSVSGLIDVTEEEWERIVGTNLTGTWLVTRSVCRRMRESGRKGSVVCISSIAGLNRGQLPGSGHYAAAKTGISLMTRALALELGPLGVRVNCVSPGLFNSEITAGLMKKEWLGRVARRTVPLRDWGTANPSLTSIVRYLLHDASAYVTGNDFIVDAGATLPGVPIFSSL